MARSKGDEDIREELEVNDINTLIKKLSEEMYKNLERMPDNRISKLFY
jgi:hypothetical protein